MRSVRIPALDVTVPSLGMGCASIMGRVGRRESLDALEAAHAGGVRYFDVARSYGYGRAEAVVGEFLRERRRDVVLTTKVGILPSVPGVVNRVLLPIARRVAAHVPAVQRLSARRGPGLAGVSKGNFLPDELVRSVETSLRELAVDRVDLLLLHDVTASDLDDDACLRCLDDIAHSGRARALGIATHVEETLKILGRAADLPFPVALVQIANNVDRVDRQRLDEVTARFDPAERPIVSTHSALTIDSESREHLVDWLERHPDRIAPLRRDGLFADDVRADLPTLLLGWALAANPDGITLCGMLRRVHVEQNLRAAALAERLGPELLALVDDWRASRLSPDGTSGAGRRGAGGRPV